MLQSGCPPSAHGRVPPPSPVGLVGVFITKVEKSGTSSNRYTKCFVRRRPPGSAASCRLAKSFRMYLFGKTLNYVIKAVVTLITTLDTVYQRPWHLIGAGPPKGGRSRIPPSVKSGSRNAESGSVLCTWGLCTARVCSGSDRPMVRRCW